MLFQHQQQQQQQLLVVGKRRIQQCCQSIISSINTIYSNNNATTTFTTSIVSGKNMKRFSRTTINKIDFHYRSNLMYYYSSNDRYFIETIRRNIGINNNSIKTVHVNNSTLSNYEGVLHFLDSTKFNFIINNNSQRCISTTTTVQYESSTSSSSSSTPFSTLENNDTNINKKKKSSSSSSSNNKFINYIKNRKIALRKRLREKRKQRKNDIVSNSIMSSSLQVMSLSQQQWIDYYNSNLSSTYPISKIRDTIKRLHTILLSNKTTTTNASNSSTDWDSTNDEDGNKTKKLPKKRTKTIKLKSTSTTSPSPRPTTTTSTTTQNNFFILPIETIFLNVLYSTDPRNRLQIQLLEHILGTTRAYEHKRRKSTTNTNTKTKTKSTTPLLSNHDLGEQHQQANENDNDVQQNQNQSQNQQQTEEYIQIVQTLRENIIQNVYYNMFWNNIDTKYYNDKLNTKQKEQYIQNRILQHTNKNNIQLLNEATTFIQFLQNTMPQSYVKSLLLWLQTLSDELDTTNSISSDNESKSTIKTSTTTKQNNNNNNNNNTNKRRSKIIGTEVNRRLGGQLHKVSEQIAQFLYIDIMVPSSSSSTLTSTSTSSSLQSKRKSIKSKDVSSTTGNHNVDVSDSDYQTTNETDSNKNNNNSIINVVTTDVRVVESQRISDIELKRFIDTMMSIQEEIIKSIGESNSYNGVDDDSIIGINNSMNNHKEDNNITPNQHKKANDAISAVFDHDDDDDDADDDDDDDEDDVQVDEEDATENESFDISEVCNPTFKTTVTKKKNSKTDTGDQRFKRHIHVKFDATNILENTTATSMLNTTFSPQRMIFIENLPIDVIESELIELYSRCGTIDWLRIYNQRHDLDPGILTPAEIVAARKLRHLSSSTSSKGGSSGRYSGGISNRWYRPRTPVYGLISFNDETSCTKALDDALRIFGMMIRKHPVRSIHPYEMKCLFIENIPDGNRATEIEYILTELLSPDVIVGLRSGQNGSAFVRSCEIKFPSFIEAYDAHLRIQQHQQSQQQQLLVQQENDTNEGSSSSGTIIRLRHEIDSTELYPTTLPMHWIRTPLDAELWWTRKLGFD